MKNILNFVDGWNGGQYLINGVTTTFYGEPKAFLIIKEKRYKAKYKIVFGSDDDMGHTYDWQKMGIGITITDGVLSSFVLVDNLPKNIKIYLEYE